MLVTRNKYTYLVIHVCIMIIMTEEKVKSFVVLFIYLSSHSFNQYVVFFSTGSSLSDAASSHLQEVVITAN